MTASGAVTQFSAGDGVRYGFLGFPLAFCALPLYVLLPNLYAREYGVPLAALGAVLLGSRLFDAVIDPLLGRWCDRLYAQSIRAVLVFGGLAALVLCAGFTLLFFPVTRDPTNLLAVTAVLLVVTYSAYSALSVAHQSWGAMLAGDEAQRSRIVAWREGMGLVGVVMASVTPTLLGLPVMVSLFVLSLALGWWSWCYAVRPNRHIARSGISSSENASAQNIWQPWRNQSFRRLMAVFLLNGIASAVPATLILFFVQDRLQAPEAAQPLFLGSFFVCGALSMPLWLRMVKRFGLARSWLCGMILSICVFLWATQLGAGDTTALCAVRPGLGQRFGFAQRVAGGRDCKQRRPWPRRGRVLWLVELRHQTQPGARRRCGAACAGRLWLHAWCARAAGVAGTHCRVLPVALRTQSTGSFGALCFPDSPIAKR
jgi:glycoside/pentoside/hexuronide:cation symporter, GPH family